MIYEYNKLITKYAHKYGCFVLEREELERQSIINIEKISTPTLHFSQTKISYFLTLFFTLV